MAFLRYDLVIFRGINVLGRRSDGDINFINRLNPLGGGKKVWPLLYVPPPNKPLCKLHVHIGGGKDNPKTASHAGLSQQVSLLQELNPSQLVLK